MLTACRVSCNYCDPEVKVCVDDTRKEIFSPGELFTLGILLMITLLVCLVPYIMVLYIFVSNKEFSQSISYNLLTWLVYVIVS
uniref:Uncharacterized protein n=1 Tax=Acrobeloides nanus TaxID=290746 RepID=A0A914CUQ1_9BILA